jgi:hypothetical protein
MATSTINSLKMGSNPQIKGLLSANMKLKNGLGFKIVGV